MQIKVEISASETFYFQHAGDQLKALSLKLTTQENNHITQSFLSITVLSETKIPSRNLRSSLVPILQT